MSLCLLFTGFSFYAPDTAAEGSYNTLRVGLIAAGIYLFMAVYSPGEGPVPFTYSAEAFPLYIRDTGMSFATATCWGFNFIISFTWPALLDAFGPTGAFGWYAAWNAAATVYCYFLLPETKASLLNPLRWSRLIVQNLTLEELDVVFSIGNREHARYYKNKLPWYLRKYILRRKVEPYPDLYQLGSGESAQKSG
jgi:hypothetical protein